MTRREPVGRPARTARPGISRRRSWDLGSARPPERRSPAVIRLAQIPLRPLVTAIARPVWIGREHLPERGGAILAGNHMGPFDALAYGHLLQASGIAPRFLAKGSLFDVPVLGALLRASGQVPVHRGSRDGRDALASARESLERGEIMMVFPEGTYTRDPEEWPMQARTGAARLALSTGAPLVPVAAWGSRRAWPVGRALPRPVPRRTLTMRIGAPIPALRGPGETEHAAAQRLTEQLMAAIAALLGETRGEEPPAVLHDPRRDPVRPEAGHRLDAEDRAVLRDAAAAASLRTEALEQARTAHTPGAGR